MAVRNTDRERNFSYAPFQKASGLPEEELKKLELTMLHALNFDVDVSPDEIFGYGEKLMSYKQTSMFRPDVL